MPLFSPYVGLDAPTADPRYYNDDIAREREEETIKQRAQQLEGQGLTIVEALQQAIAEYNDQLDILRELNIN